MTLREPKGRSDRQLRPIEFVLNATRYAEGSVLVKVGHTHVLCTATVDENTPPWLKGSGKGWVTAEYSMLPRATHTRTKRDREKVSGRTQEIQRLIGRALRSCVDLKALGERQILIDCDVLQADGGTRCASITGACVALWMAVRSLEKSGKIPTGVFVDTVSAISVGLQGETVLVDLDYNEDSSCAVDMNFVMTGKGAFVEIQGTAEHHPFTQEQMQTMTDAAIKALKEVTVLQSGIMNKSS